MHKGELIRWVSKETRLRQEDVSDALEATLKLIQGALKEGRSVTFPGFGTFYVSKRAAGKVRDVRTGKPREYAARKVALFRTGDVLKRAVGGLKARKKK